ncbi:hypothetical protein [Endozoicomonas sp. GU-1]|uniref:hypothetical protein n=1 Tax=Endozoicomonas sp. GU-1 TaxID=3009078 RepID=UPI0022B39D63|nr:hypothetical protein [Endozoicomonas sp. GU-1]WBA82047.1 hypothetical protein O2T12_02435 [Endozoicomonas sp. GU-1]WBA84995.1 hypothetical protein O3276_17200 [Endozoicomonas sp. GU-1]
MIESGSSLSLRTQFQHNDFSLTPINTSKEVESIPQQFAEQLPHQIAVELRQKDTLPGIEMIERSGSKVASLAEKLKEGPVSFIIQSKGQNNIPNELTITCSLNAPKPGCFICKDDKTIMVNVESSSGITEATAVGGFWVSDDQECEAESIHCLLDFGERRVMDYRLAKSASGDSRPDSYQVVDSTLQVNDFIIPAVTHLETATHDDGRYGTHNAVFANRAAIPAALFEHDFEHWNSPPEACRMLFRSLGGALSHASKNPEPDLRTFLHAFTTTCIGSGLFLGGDEVAAAVQTALGYPSTSFLGTPSDNPVLERFKYAGVILSLVSFFGFQSTKNALGINSQFIENPAEKRCLSVKMWVIELFGSQVLTMLTVGASIAGGEYFATGSTEQSNPRKLFTDLLLAHTVVLGLGAAIQSRLIDKGLSPTKAWLFFALFRLAIFRGATLGVQLMTDHLFADGVKPGKIQSIVIASVINELVITILSGMSYLSGRSKPTDGSEEQLMAYEQDISRPVPESGSVCFLELETYAHDQQISVHPLNRFRLNLSRSIDAAPKTLWGKVAYYCLHRSPLGVLSKVVTSPFISALSGQSDTEYRDILKLHQALLRDRAVSLPVNQPEATGII